MTKPRRARNGPGNCILKPRQEVAALVLAAGRTQDEASRESGAGSRTIKTWMTLPAFRSHIRQLREDMTGRAVGRLANNMGHAVETLTDLCSNGKSETVRLGAARAILELGNRLRETVELEARIADLEDRRDLVRVA